MPRKAHIVKREIVPDPMYQSTLVSKFVNCMMWGGKKSTSKHILYDALDIVQKKTNDEPLKLFKKAVENVKPVLEVKSRRVGGSTYQVPVEVGATRRTSLSIRWILTYSRARGEKSMEEKLAGELIDAANNRGNAIKKKGRHPSNGGGEQGFCTLSMVNCYATYDSIRENKKYRHHGAHRCRQDDHDGADSLLHRDQLQDR